jgi:threonine dehydrogenase-like Zn-dependent dehydrogenase
MIKGAAEVFVVDNQGVTASGSGHGCKSINMRKGDPVKQLLDATNGRGTDRGCECVGYQCYDRHGKEVSNYTMNCPVQSTKATGGIGVLSVSSSHKIPRRRAHDE